MLDAMFKVCFTESFDSQHFVETSSKPSFASPVGRYPFHLFLAVFRDWLLSFLITWNSSSTWKERRLESSSPLFDSDGFTMVGSCGTSSSRQPFVRSVVRAGEFLSRNVVDIVVRWLMTVVHSFGEDKRVSTWARFIRPEPEPCLRHLLRSEARLCSLSSRRLVWPVSSIMCRSQCRSQCLAWKWLPGCFKRRRWHMIQSRRRKARGTGQAGAWSRAEVRRSSWSWEVSSRVVGL